MGYIPFFLTLGGFILLFVMVVNSTFKSKKNRVNQLSEQAIAIMGKFGLQGKEASNEKNTLVSVAVQSFQENKEAFLKSNPEIFEKELIPIMKSLKLSKASYNQLVAEKPYSFIAKIMGHQPLS